MTPQMIKLFEQTDEQSEIKKLQIIGNFFINNIDSYLQKSDEFHEFIFYGLRASRSTTRSLTFVIIENILSCNEISREILNLIFNGPRENMETFIYLLGKYHYNIAPELHSYILDKLRKLAYPFQTRFFCQAR